MKHILLLICIGLFNLPILAQSGAHKIDEFGSLTCDDYLSRMDNFQTQLSADPNSKGYIFIYEGKLANNVLLHIGEARSYKRTMIRRMAFRRFDKDKIVFVEAGFREMLTVEFWTVPQEQKFLRLLQH